MKNNYIFTIENGPKLIFYQDTTKHSVSASVIVQYGGINHDFEINGAQYHTEDGMAHFLEHLLIEHSIYGNILTEFHNNYISCNGCTTSKITRFDIDTVHDFEENLIRLIQIVNIPKFTAEDIEETKPAIIEEIRKNKDSKFRNLSIITKKCLFHNINYANNVGTEEYIRHLGYDDIKRCYDVFYQPENQIIAICGNFDINQIKQVIETTYKEIIKDKIDYKIPQFLEPFHVVKKADELLFNTHQTYTQVSYKISIKEFGNYDSVKLSFYLDYFLYYNFGISSNVYRYIVENNISTTDIDINTYIINDFIIVEIGCYTDQSEQFVKLIKQTIEDKMFDEEDFELRKKKSIISLILREEFPNNMLEPFIDNIITFKYEDIDKIEDIEVQTYEDYKETINKLDFSNYCITKLIPKKEI